MEKESVSLVLIGAKSMCVCVDVNLCVDCGMYVCVNVCVNVCVCIGPKRMCVCVRDY